jgi:hypothetical protein
MRGSLNEFADSPPIKQVNFLDWTAGRPGQAVQSRMPRKPIPEMISDASGISMIPSRNFAFFFSEIVFTSRHPDSL